MIAIISLLPIFGFATLFYVYFKKSVSVSIFFSITLIITILYLFGMFDYLKTGTYLLYYGGIILFVVMSIVYNKLVFKALKSVPFIMFTLMSVLYLYFMKDAHFFFWDEYSHWGAFIKYMYSTNSFYDLNTAAAHLNYPPGISLWDYFIIKPFDYSEGNIYFAYFLIIFSSTLMMYEKLKFRDLYIIILVLLTQIVIYAGFGHWFSCIYVDHVVGAVFSGLVFSYLVDNFKTKELILFVFPLIAIVLIKEIGLYFGLSFIGLVILLRVFNTYNQNNTITISIKQNLKSIIILFFLFIVMIITLKSWSLRQENLGISSNGQTITGVVENLLSDEKLIDPKIKSEIKNRFWYVVENQQLHKEKVSLNYNEFSYSIMPKFHKTIKLTTVSIFIFFFIVFFINYKLSSSKVEKHKLIIIYGYVSFVTFIYLIILLLSYTVAFGVDGLRIPSYVRYINMSILPMLLIAFMTMLPAYRLITIKKYPKQVLFSFVFTFIVLASIVRPYLPPLYSQLQNGVRKEIDAISYNIRKVVPAKTKLFVVFPIRNNGSLNNMIRYDLVPINSTISKYDFEKKSFNEMIKIYSKYQYVWFVRFDNNLVKKNKRILKQTKDKKVFTLYKVTVSNNNIAFTPVL